jgi:hypothetical protein
MWRNIVGPDRPLTHAHCVLDTSGYKQSEYGIRIAFPLQQRLHERPSMLRCTHIVGLVGAAVHNHNGYKERISNFRWMLSSFLASVAVTAEFQVTEA